MPLKEENRNEATGLWDKLLFFLWKTVAETFRSICLYNDPDHNWGALIHGIVAAQNSVVNIIKP